MFWILFLSFLSPYLYVFIPDFLRFSSSLAVFSISIEWIAFINAVDFIPYIFISLPFLPLCFIFPFLSSLRSCLSVAYLPLQNYRMYIFLCFLFPSTKFTTCMYISLCHSNCFIFSFISHLVSFLLNQHLFPAFLSVYRPLINLRCTGETSSIDDVFRI